MLIESETWLRGHNRSTSKLIFLVPVENAVEDVALSAPWYTNTTLVSGFFLLIGAFIGLSGTLLSSYLNGYVARNEAQRKEALEVRAASQLVGSAFLDGVSYITTIRQIRRWLPGVSLTLKPWHTHAPVLARSLSSDEFFSLYQAAGALENLILIRDRELSRSLTGEVNDGYLEQLRQPLGEMEYASSLLRTITEAIPKIELKFYIPSSFARWLYRLI